ncbi:unnamed protein product [Sphagnum jensenii]|uniref:DUF1648 domain-containing protein n=1 Tax=Sphagnum jensenii TaxID=128206 RepID=A0ABP1AFU7_9BRYO
MTQTHIRMFQHTLFLSGVLATLSVSLAAIDWHKTPAHVPLWWNLHAHPLLWVPRWLGLLLLPVLTLLVPCSLYLILSLWDGSIKNHGEESKYMLSQIILLPALFLFTVQSFTIVPAAMSETHDLGARLFVATVAVWLLFWFGKIILKLEPNILLRLIAPWETTNSSYWSNVYFIASRIFSMAGESLFLCAWLVPIGWPLLLVFLVCLLGPFVAMWGVSYAYSQHSGPDQPLVNQASPQQTDT